MQAATEKIRDVPAGAECHVAQFGYDEAQTQTRSTGRVRGEALRYMRHRKPRLQRGYEREQETGKQCKAVPTLRKQADSVHTEPACFMLVVYLNAARLGKNALTICTISDNPFTGEELDAEARQNTFTQMMEIALEIA